MSHAVASSTLIAKPSDFQNSLTIAMASLSVRAVFSSVMAPDSGGPRKRPRIECNGDAFLRPVGAARQVGDRQFRCRRCQYGARRSHPVQQPENLKLRFQLVRHAVNRQVGFAHRILNRLDESEMFSIIASGFPGLSSRRNSSCAWCRFEGITSSSITRKPARSSGKRQPSAQRSRTDDGDAIARHCQMKSPVRFQGT